jgi:hypothetical protein
MEVLTTVGEQVGCVLALAGPAGTPPDPDNGELALSTRPVPVKQ